MANKKTLNQLSVDDLAMTLDEHLCNQTEDILKIAAILMGINRETVNGISKRQVKKMIEKIYEDVLEDVDKSEQDKKTYLISIINEVTTIMPKPDNKQRNAPVTSEQKKDTDPDDRVKENTKVVNDGDKESEGEGKMNILRELGVLKKTSLLRKEFRVKGSIGEAGQKEKHTYVSLMHQLNEAKAAEYDQDEIVSRVIRAMVPSLTLRNVLETTNMILTWIDC